MQDSDNAPVGAPAEAHDDAPAKRRKSRKNTRAVTHGITSASPVIPRPRKRRIQEKKMFFFIILPGASIFAEESE